MIKDQIPSWRDCSSLIIPGLVFSICLSFTSEKILGQVATVEVCDATWTGSITLESDVIVPQGCTLTVEPGAQIQSDNSIIVFGQIEAIGLPNDSIFFDVGSLVSRTSSSQFILDYVRVNEKEEFVSNFPNMDCLSLSLTIDSLGSVKPDWHESLPELADLNYGSGEYSTQGELYQDFEDGVYNPWYSMLYYHYGYVSGNSLSIETENGNSYVTQGPAVGGCTTASSTVNDMRAPFSTVNEGEKIERIEFDYRLFGSNPSLIVELKDTPGCSDGSGWVNLEASSQPQEWQHYSFDVRNLEIASGCLRLRAYQSNPTGGCSSFYNRGQLDNLLISSNYRPNSFGYGVIDLLIRSVSSGGMALSNVQWFGNLDFACDECELHMNRTKVNPPISTSSIIVSHGLRLLGNIDADISDCEIQGFTNGSGIQLDDFPGPNANLNLLRTKISGCSTGVVIGKGWTSTLSNTLISDCAGTGLIHRDESTALVTFTTLANNGGYGLQKTSSGFLQVENSIIWGNNPVELVQISCPTGSIGLAHTNVSGLASFGLEGVGIVSQTSNYDLNPQLMSDYTLDMTSPCIDAGTLSLQDAYRPPGQGEARADIGWTGGPNLEPDGVAGCTDEEACNFDSEAFSDDNSCVYPPVYYDCESNCNNDLDADGICDEVDAFVGSQESLCGQGTLWSAELQQCVGFVNCPADLTNDGNVSVNDVLFVLSFYGTSCSQ